MKIEIKQDKVNDKLVKYHYARPKYDITSILFIHGFGVPPKYYESYLGRLAENFEVIAPDLTDLDKLPLTTKEYAEFINDFREQLNIPVYNLVGYSYGGGISLQYANDQTDEGLERVIGINPVIDTDYGVQGFIKRGMYMTLKEMFRYGIGGNPKRGNIALNCLKFFKEHPSELLQNMQDISQFKQSNIYVRQPTRIIMSDKDDFFNIKDINYESFANLQVIEIPGSDHDLFFNHRDNLMYYLTEDYLHKRLEDIYLN